MSATHIATPSYLNTAPASAISAGRPTVAGPLIGFAEADVAASELGSFRLDGTFDIAKATGAGTAFAVGDIVRYNTSTNQATRDPAQPFAGICTRAAATTDTLVRTRMVNAASPTVLTFAVEDLAAGADIADRVLAALPRGGQIVSAGFVANGSFAGVDGSNTMVLALTDGAGNTICTTTYNAVTVPTNNGYNTCGIPDATHSLLTAGETFRLSITNGSTANPPAGTLVVELLPNR
jgi:predicted RecA/RadA family phage recombinase